MNKELEEAIKILEYFITEFDEEEVSFTQVEKAIKTVLNYIDNSISKEVIKEKIEEVRKMKFEDERLNGATIDFAACKFEEILEGK